MQKHQISNNARVAIIQTILVGVILFILYRYLLNTVGVEQLGIWSFVLATTSATRISQLGISGSVVKFVAKYLARGETESTIKVIETASISIGVVIGGVMFIIYYPLIWLLGYFLPETAMPTALSIFPYALVSFWLTSIAGVFQSGLDGCQRIDVRGVIMIVCNIIHLVVTMMFVPQYGLLGIAFAQVVQAGLLLFLCVIFLHHELPSLSFVPHHWNLPIFKEMLLYGVNFQVTSIMTMLFDPLTKMLLAKFGTLGMVGYYEMANRMITQVRGLVVSANQVLVPVIATYKENTPDKINTLYYDIFRLIMYNILIIYGAIFSIIPLISKIWIGHYEPIFIKFSSILVIAWFLNTLSAPAYFNNLGLGQLRWNTIAHIIMALLNVMLGFLFGTFFGGLGVVVASALALVVGSCTLIFAYHRENNIYTSQLFQKENCWLALAICVAIGYGWSVYFMYHEKLSNLSLVSMIVLGFISLILIPAWYHPVRHQIMNWFSIKVGNTRILE